ncbi:MAG: DUF4288 domain-containing protein [Armatimonadetes bacterium]|nr:DUF4288 domain-containing protein [Armatimonadota bacterium]MDW8026933.1 DUF4288 domain-containing protein [Armatimonadota bacterium]
MWFTVSLLFCNKRIEPEVHDLETIRLPEIFRNAVHDFLQSLWEQERIWERFWRQEQFWEWERLLTNFCRYAVAKGVRELGDCRYEQMLGFLENRYLHGVSKSRLKQEVKLLSEFMRFLWARAGKTEDPLESEDLDEDFDWLEEWFEESIVLIQASDEKEAWQKAEALGEQIALEHQREANFGVRWEFVGVLSVYELLDEELVDRAEIFSRFLTAKEAKTLMKAYRLAKRARKV